MAKTSLHLSRIDIFLLPFIFACIACVDAQIDGYNRISLKMNVQIPDSQQIRSALDNATNVFLMYAVLKLSNSYEFPLASYIISSQVVAFSALFVGLLLELLQKIWK